MSSDPKQQELDLEAISQRYFSAWEARDPDAIVALHTDDTQFWTHHGGSPIRGKEAVREAFAALFEQFPEFSFEVYRVMTGTGHWVLDWALIDGDIRFDCLDLVEVSDDGLITRKDTFIDSVQLETALGTVSAARASREQTDGIAVR